MSILEVRPAVTSTVTTLVFPSKPTTRLAKPYHYRRNGIYYMRLRATGSTTEAAAVSLQTSNRRDALDASEQLAGFVRAFHLENPEAPWSKLKEHFRAVSVELFESGRDGNVTHVWGDLHDSNAGPVGGSTRPVKSVENVPVSLSVLSPAMTFEILSALYLADRGQDQKTSTLKETKICHGTIASALGELDMQTHSRADLVALREHRVKQLGWGAGYPANLFFQAATQATPPYSYFQKSAGPGTGWIE
ncbi:hypothetical protein [Pseudomonas sp. NPDC087615]|uniref:hypothetical protein n=1 Tax=Pseudomonas sp. NPDC087615 TaxID=3364443 RepID=UPI0038186A50